MNSTQSKKWDNNKTLKVLVEYGDTFVALVANLLFK